MKISFYVFLCMLPFINGFVVKDGKCPDVEVLQNITLRQLSGVWYSIEVFPNDFDGNLKCVVDTFNFAPDGVGTTVYEGINIATNKVVKSSFGMRPEGDPKVGNYIGEFTVKGEIEKIKAKILATDYDNYFVYYSCQEIDSKSYSLAWIESRTRRMPEEYLNIAHNLLKKYTIDTSKLIKIDQENCTN